MTSTKLSVITGALCLAASVTAHGHVKGIYVNGGPFVRGFTIGDAYQNPVPESIGWQTKALDNGFVDPAKYGTSDIACHLSATPGKLFATVAAGSKIRVQWDSSWPDSHKGPVLDYLAPYASSAADLKFFKFAEEGLNNGKWAAEKITASQFWEVTIPASIAPGKYVYRHEIIALHGAQGMNGAQNYPQCMNLEITGSGTAKPAGISGTSLYKDTDPGIYIPGFYSPGITSYKIPGPAVFSSGGTSPAPSQGSSSSATTTSTSKPSSTTTTKPSTTATATATTTSKSKTKVCRPKTKSSTTTSAPAATGSATATAAKWGQCGGINWNGPKTCAAGSTCQKQNDWYWQCL